MALVRLAPMTAPERAAFAEAQIEDYAAWLLERGDEATPAGARARAESEIEPELATAVVTGDLLWTASREEDGRTVGWLWVKRAEAGLPVDAAFLYQIQVVVEVRRRGFGRAMLATVEGELAGLGYGELRLNVWDTNVAVQQLYATTGYELVERLVGKRQLRKVLSPPGTEPVA